MIERVGFRENRRMNSPGSVAELLHQFGGRILLWLGVLKVCTDTPDDFGRDIGGVVDIDEALLQSFGVEDALYAVLPRLRSHGIHCFLLYRDEQFLRLLSHFLLSISG